MAFHTLFLNAAVWNVNGSTASICEYGISLDGTWQRPAHVSHNDVVTAVSIEVFRC